MMKNNVETYSFTIVVLLLTSKLSSEKQDNFGNWLQLAGLVLRTYSSKVPTLKIKKRIRQHKKIHLKRKRAPNKDSFSFAII